MLVQFLVNKAKIFYFTKNKKNLLKILQQEDLEYLNQKRIHTFVKKTNKYVDSAIKK